MTCISKLGIFLIMSFTALYLFCHSTLLIFFFLNLNGHVRKKGKSRWRPERDNSKTAWQLSLDLVDVEISKYTEIFFICQSISGHLLQGVWFVLRQVLGTWVQNDSGLHVPNQSVSGLVTSHIGCTWWQTEIHDFSYRREIYKSL